MNKKIRVSLALAVALVLCGSGRMYGQEAESPVVAAPDTVMSDAVTPDAVMPNAGTPDAVMPVVSPAADMQGRATATPSSALLRSTDWRAESAAALKAEAAAQRCNDAEFQMQKATADNADADTKDKKADKGK